MAQGDDRGDWYFPNGTILPFSKSHSRRVFENREDKRVDLRRRMNPDTPQGIYRCDIQISNGTWATVYVGLYKNMNRGQHVCIHMCTACVMPN